MHMIIVAGILILVMIFTIGTIGFLQYSYIMESSGWLLLLITTLALASNISTGLLNASMIIIILSALLACSGFGLFKLIDE